MDHINEIYVGGRYSELGDATARLSSFCTALSNKVMLEIDLRNYPLSEYEYKTKAVKEFELYYSQEDVRRRDDPKYKRKYQSTIDADAYFKRLQEYDLIELNEVKQLLQSYIQVSSVHNDSVTTTFLGSLELESRFTPKSLTTIGGLYKTVMYQLTPSIVDYFSTGSNLFIPIVNKGTYLGENIGHEKSRLEARPCIIVSTNRINYKNTNVVVVPLSKVIKFKPGSTTKLAYDWHYVLRKSNYPKLSYDSAVQCEDIRCVSKARMGKYICQVSSNDMTEIKKRIKSTLQI